MNQSGVVHASYGGDLAALLLSRKADVLAVWERLVRDDPSVPDADRLPKPILYDHMPAFIDRLAEAFRRNGTSGAEGARAASEACAEEHARQRVVLRYAVGSALREWAHMHAAILDVFEDAGATLDARTAKIIAAAVHESTTRVAVDMQAAAIQEAQRRAAELEAVVASVPEAIYIGTRHGITRTNEPGLALLGYDSIEELNKNLDALVDELDIRDARTGQRVRPEGVAFAYALGGSPFVSEVFITHRRTKEERLLRTAAAPIILDGKVLGAVAINTDITDARKHEARLVDEGRFRERFMGILGHDLRNPLGAIVMGASALVASPDTPPAHVRVLERVLRSARRMSGMIDALLDVTRTRLAGGIPLEPRDTDLADLVRNAIEELDGAHPGRELRLSVQGDLRGHWDPDRLAQVVSNLLGNALEHGARDQPIDVELEGRVDSVRLTVRNRGTEVPAELRATLFEPFQRSRAVGDDEHNLGLGLYIVGEIVRGHGGQISVRSEAGETAFDVELPRRRVTS